MGFTTAATVTIHADSSQFEQQMSLILGRLIEQSIPIVSRAMRVLDRVVAGLEARYYVRAGLDLAYASETALTGLVAEIMAGDPAALFFLQEKQRAQIAAAAVRGWVTHRHPAADVDLVWVRFLDGQRVWVTADTGAAA